LEPPKVRSLASPNMRSAALVRPKAQKYQWLAAADIRLPRTICVSTQASRDGGASTADGSVPPHSGGGTGVQPEALHSDEGRAFGGQRTAAGLLCRGRLGWCRPPCDVRLAAIYCSIYTAQCSYTPANTRSGLDLRPVVIPEAAGGATARRIRILLRHSERKRRLRLPLSTDRLVAPVSTSSRSRQRRQARFLHALARCQLACSERRDGEG